MTPNVDSNRILLVEGKNDEHFIKGIYSKVSRSLPFKIKSKCGFSNLIKGIPLEITSSTRPEVIGIVTDSNSNTNERWNEIITAIGKEREIGTDISIDRKGTILDTEPRIGIWLMPDNGSEGAIEDLMEKMIPGNDRVLPVSRRYIKLIDSEKKKKIKSKNFKKAVFHAWLATSDSPGLIEPAIRNGQLDTDHEIAVWFVEWLKRLFGNSSSSPG